MGRLPLGSVVVEVIVGRIYVLCHHFAKIVDDLMLGLMLSFLECGCVNRIRSISHYHDLSSILLLLHSITSLPFVCVSKGITPFGCMYNCFCCCCGCSVCCVKRRAQVQSIFS